MSISLILSKAHKFEVETQTIAIQTDCTESIDPDLINFHSTHENFCEPLYGKIVKIQPCPGDIVEIEDFLNCSELSSIQDPNSFENNSILNSFVSEDFDKGSSFEKNMKKNDPQTTSTVKDNTVENSQKYTWSKTPNFHKNKQSSRIDLSESYEEMIETLGTAESGFKESFLQLIEVEKKSLRKQFYKRFPSTNFLKEV